MTRAGVPEDTRARARELLAQGLKLSEVALRTGVSRDTVRRLCPNSKPFLKKRVITFNLGQRLFDDLGRAADGAGMCRSSYLRKIIADALKYEGTE